MKRILSTYTLLALMALALLPACRKDDDDVLRIPGDAVYDFATLLATDKLHSEFAMQRTQDTEEMLFRTPFSFEGNKNITPGKRMVICYKESGFTDERGLRDIILYGYILPSNTEQNVITDPEKMPQAPSQPFDMVSIWRTGCYININTHIFVYKPAAPAWFVLKACPATIDSECPELTLSYRMREGEDGLNQSSVYASFDISELWLRDSCRRVRISYPTPTGVEYTVFTKQ